MNTKHTRGPWHWDSDPIKGDSLGRVRYRVTALGKTVTQCYYSSGDASAEHDARLIAAAPELLDALRVLCRNFPTDSDMEAVGWTASEISRACRAYDEARAALKKATGEAS